MLLAAIYKSPLKLQSNYARYRAGSIGMLASLGFISTVEGPGQYGNKWRITGTGVELLKNLGAL